MCLWLFTNLLVDQGPSLCSGPLELNSHCAGPALSPGKHVQNQRETLSWTMRHLSYSYSTFCLPFGAFHARYNSIGCLFRGLEPPIYLSFDDMGKGCWSLVTWIKLFPEVNELQGLIICQWKVSGACEKNLVCGQHFNFVKSTNVVQSHRVLVCKEKKFDVHI